MRRDAILVLVPLPASTPSAILAGRPENDRRAVLWAALEPQVRSRLQPWLDGGWQIVPGTLGPRSLRMGMGTPRANIRSPKMHS